jgi:hypothetical protein
LNIYLAASYSRRREMRGYAAQLPEGIKNTARWIDQEVEEEDVTSDQEMRSYADRDLVDLERADAFVVFTDQPSRRGGYWVELGLCLGNGVEAIVVGPRVNVFCYLPEVQRFDSWDECLASLKRRLAVARA